MPDAARLLKLADDLDQEIGSLDAVAQEARACLNLLRGRKPTLLELRGAGDIVHDFYNVVEHCLERVALEMNSGLPAGSDRHATLLARMPRDQPGVRPTVLRARTRQELDEYLRFRNLFRHRYGFEIEWRKLEPLLTGMEGVHAEVRADLVGFASTLRSMAEVAGR